MFIGENYEVLKNLKLTHTKFKNGKLVGLIDVIYIDPPYNTQQTKTDGNDYKEKITSTSKFIYRDKFRRTGWLNMMNERLKLAKDLLSEKGVIFISIDDNEQAYLKVLCDEIFGEQNFIANIIWRKKNTGGGSNKKTIENEIEYILCYKASSIDDSEIFCGQDIKLDNFPLSDKYFQERGGYKLKELDHGCSPSGFQYIESLDYEILDPRSNKYFKNHHNILKPKSYRYLISKNHLIFAQKHDFIVIKNNKWGHPVAYRKMYSKIELDYKNFKIVPRDSGNPYTNFINNIIDDSKTTTSSGTINNKKILNSNCFPHPKPPTLIKYLLKMIKNKNAIVLDFFAGSGTTGQAVMEKNEEDGGNRKFILCTNNESNIAYDITWEKIYRIINGKGSKNEVIDYKFSETKSYLTNNSLKTFEIKHYPCGINVDPNSLFNLAKVELKKINPSISLNDIDLNRALSSLKPYCEANKK